MVDWHHVEKRHGVVLTMTARDLHALVHLLKSLTLICLAVDISYRSLKFVSCKKLETKESPIRWLAELQDGQRDEVQVLQRTPECLRQDQRDQEEQQCTKIVKLNSSFSYEQMCTE
ncbi:unnamed protein product [Calypogeia fissa]